MELEKLHLLNQLGHAMGEQNRLKKQIEEEEKNKEEEMKKLEELKNKVDEHLEVEKEKLEQEEGNASEQLVQLVERLLAEQSELMKKIEMEREQRENGLKILMKDLENAIKQEQEKEKQAKERRKQEKETQRRKDVKKQKMLIQNAVSEGLQQEMDKFTQVIGNKLGETANKNNPNEMAEQVQKELDPSPKQSEKKLKLEKIDEKPPDKIQEPSRLLDFPLDPIPAPNYVPEPPSPSLTRDRPEVNTKYSKDISKAITLKQQRGSELATSNDNRIKKKNKIDEDANKLQTELAKVERNIKITEEAQQKDIAITKDKDKEKKDERKAAKQRIKDRIQLFPRFENEQVSLQVKIDKQQKEGEKILETMDNELEAFKKQMNKEQESLDKL